MNSGNITEEVVFQTVKKCLQRSPLRLVKQRTFGGSQKQAVSFSSKNIKKRRTEAPIKKCLRVRNTDP